MCYIEDCEDHYQPPVDPTPECPYEDCEGGSGNTGSESGNTGGSDGKNPSGNCCCDDRTDTGGETNPGGEINPGGETNPGGNTDQGDCDDCADCAICAKCYCGIIQYYKAGDDFYLYPPTDTDYYAWCTDSTLATVGTDGKVHVIREGSAYICLRSHSNPNLRRCWKIIVTSSSQGGSGTNPGGNVIAVTGVGISGPNYGYVSDWLTMSHTVYPANATNKAVYWASSDSSVARFNADGVLH